MAVNLFLSPLISVLVQRVAGSLIKQFCQMRGMDEDHKKLQRLLLTIQEKIVNFEKRKAYSPVVRVWLKDLHDVAYEASNVLDEFRDEALQQQPSVSNKVSLSKKLKNTLDKIDEIVTEMNKLFVLCEQEYTDDRPLTCSAVNEADVIGRDCDKEEIVSLLLDLQCQRPDRPVNVLPIVGVGGLGKTTLAQLVYNDNRVKECFDLLIWVCVSQGFNVVNIIKSIIEVATNEEGISTSNIEVLRRHLHGILAQKKYLLVLDDVSIEEAEKWDSLKALLFSADCSGSIVLVTTCSKRVAFMVETIPSYHVTPLNEEDSWKLFQNIAFREGMEGLPELVAIGRTIVRNCGGSPRALKVIGNLLSYKREVDDWHAIAENSWDDEVPANEISLGIPAAEQFNFSLSLKLLRHQTFKEVRLTKRKRSFNFILNNSIYKWQRCTGFDSPEPHSSSSSSLHTDLDTLLYRLRSSDPEAQHTAAGAIRLLARTNEENQLAIAQAGAIPLLNNLLSSPDSNIQEHAVTALRNLSIHQENRVRIVASGSVAMIVHTLKTGNMEARENAAATLFSLSLVDKYKRLIGATWAIPALVSLLNEGTIKGKKYAITALFNLCIYQGNNGRAVRAGLIPLLMCLMTDQTGLLIEETVAFMAILANHPEGRLAIRMAEAIPTLVEIVKSGSPSDREDAAAVLVELCSGEGGEMYIHQAAECGLLGPIRDLAENGTARGKRQAFMLEVLMIQYSCSGLELDLVDQTGLLTDEEMTLMTMLACHPERTEATGMAEAVSALVETIQNGSLGRRENAVAMLNFCSGEGGKLYIEHGAKCGLFDPIRDLAANGTYRGKEKAILLKDLMIRNFISGPNLVDQSAQLSDTNDF